MDIEPTSAINEEPGWDRRQFLRNSVLGVSLLGAGGVLAACTSSAKSSTASTAAASAGGTSTGGTSTGGASTAAASTSAGVPKRGGTLRIGSTGGGSTDTLDPQTWGTAPDQLRVQQLYDPLVWMNNAGQPELTLAKSITPNATATQWTIEIPSGITTHSGKAFTADDVLFSFRRIVSNKFPGASVLGPVDLTASKVLDPTRVLLVYTQPFGALIETLTFPFFYMVPQGFDPKNPDGTGPFKFQSFTAGTQSTFVRNDNYWQSGKPYLDKIITIDVSDESTQVNGLVSGQFDVINQLSATSIAGLKGSGSVHIAANNSGSWVPFTQDNASKPFSDVRVRQAMRLIVDRKQMLEQVFAGNGSIANDVFSPYDAGYPHDLPQREQDLAQAKSLLKSAGYPDLQLSLLTDPGAAGEVSMAEVFATQAKAAGVSVAVQQYTVGDFYTKYYQKVPFAMDYGPNETFLVNAGQLMVGNAAYYNACHFNDAEYNSTYAKAIATTDTATRNDLIGQLAHIDYDRGGYIVPVFTPVIEAWSSSVGGIEKSVTGVSPGNADFKNFWIS
jgi:peptide/nickel transport system substrate-binding protein